MLVGLARRRCGPSLRLRVALLVACARTAPARGPAGALSTPSAIRSTPYGSLLETIASLDIAAANEWLATDVPARDIADRLGAAPWPLVKP
jgi:hypothetical protein